MCGIVILLYLMSHLALSSGNVAPKTACVDGTLATGACECGSEGVMCTAWMTCFAATSTCADECAKTDGTTATSYSCECGSSLCTAGTVCLAETSTCSYPECPTIGTATVACKCGTEDCTVGATCSEGTCSYPDCAIIDGSSATTSSCQCGSYLCTKGEFCSYYDYCLPACADGAVATAACKCGTEDCLVGDTCSAATSTCITPPVCPTGAGAATAGCKCGSGATCTAGQTCDATGNSGAGICTNPGNICPTGAGAATAGCTCGSGATCTTGQTCDAWAQSGAGSCTNPVCPTGAGAATAGCTCGSGATCTTGQTCDAAASSGAGSCTNPECNDNGCDKAYDGKGGKGICVPINRDDWNVINKDIDFTAPMKTGLCKSSGDTGCCGCFKQKMDKCEDKRCVSIPKKKILRECFKKGEDVKPNMFNTGKMCAKRKDCYCFQNCKTTKKCKKSGGQCLGSAPEWPYQKKVKPCDKKKKCKCYIPIPT